MQEEKSYLESDLSIQTLADKLQVHPKALSRIINQDLNCNFFEFVNRYRLTEAKRQLADKSLIQKAVILIAYDSGFNSKSAFNAIFRKYENTTPTEYRKRKLQKGN